MRWGKERGKEKEGEKERGREKGRKRERELSWQSAIEARANSAETTGGGPQ